MKQSGLTLVEMVLMLTIAVGFFSVGAWAYNNNHNHQMAIQAATRIIQTSERVRNYMLGDTSIMFSKKAYQRGLYPDHIEFDTTAWQSPISGGGHFRVNSLNLSYVGAPGYTQEDGFMVVVQVPPSQCVELVQLLTDEFDVIRLNSVIVKAVDSEINTPEVATQCQQGSGSLVTIQGLALT